MPQLVCCRTNLKINQFSIYITHPCHFSLQSSSSHENWKLTIIEHYFLSFTFITCCKVIQCFLIFLCPALPISLLIQWCSYMVEVERVVNSMLQWGVAAPGHYLHCIVLHFTVAHSQNSSISWCYLQHHYADGLQNPENDLLY